MSLMHVICTLHKHWSRSHLYIYLVMMMHSFDHCLRWQCLETSTSIVLPVHSLAMLLEVCLIKACALTPLMPKELALAMGWWSAKYTGCILHWHKSLCAMPLTPFNECSHYIRIQTSHVLYGWYSPNVGHQPCQDESSQTCIHISLVDGMEP